MYEYLAEHAKDCLDQTAISYFNRDISYRSLLMNIRATASAFSSLGVKKGDIVTLALPNVPENIYCIYALNMLGAIADMIDLRAKGDILQHYIIGSGSTIAVVCDLFAENVLSVVKKTNVKTLIWVAPLASLPYPFNLYKRSINLRKKSDIRNIRWEKFKATHRNGAITMNRNPDLVACIAHTSGTTSRPKGVMLTSRQINSLVSQYVSIGFEHGDNDTLLNQVPPFLAYSFLSFHFPFALHMCIRLLPDYRPDEFAANLMKFKPNHVFAGPGDWANLISPKHNRHTDYSSLKSLASGSDHLDEKAKRAITEVLRKGGCQNNILEGYGMTECCSAAATQLPTHIVENSVGIPLPKNIFCIYDNDRNTELPYDMIGEICMCGPSVMKGYFNDPEETDNVLRKHEDGKLWLHTGDIGTLDCDGNIFLMGRKKRIIIRFDGIKIYPLNIEKTVLKHPAVRACCAVGMPDTVRGRGAVPVIYVVLKEKYDSIVAEEELKSICKKELAENYQPQAYHFIECLPLTPNGKVDYRALEKLAGS